MKKRDKILAKFGGKCSYCGEDMTGKRFHVDHADPLMRYSERIAEPYYQHVDTKERRAHLGGVPWQEYRKWEKKQARYKTTCHNPHLDTYENSYPACISCNMNKGGANTETFRFKISHGVNSMNDQHAQYRMAKRFGLIQETGIAVVFHFEKYLNEKAVTQ